MQVFATPPIQRQKRSLSYNDLKKKRLMRSAQSQKKLASQQQEQSTVKKQGMTEVKTILSTLPQDEKVIESCINELKGVLGSLRSRSSKKCIIAIKQSLTERPSIKQSIDLDTFKNKPMWSNVEQSGDTKQLIKHLLNKNKSQRRLIKFNDIRDKFKKEKERSLSNEKNTSAVKAIPSPFKDAKDKTIRNGLHVNEDTYAKCTQPTIKMAQPRCLEEELDDLQNCKNQSQHRKWEAEIVDKENEEANSQQLQINDISSIDCRNPDKFNESELKLISPPQTASLQGSFLQLLNENLSKHKKPLPRQLRRRGDMQRMKKILPSGFFDN